jgi:hypothetical protein
LPFGYLSGLPLALLGCLALDRLELRFGLLTMLLQRIVGAVRRDGLFWIGSGNVMLDAVLVQDPTIVATRLRRIAGVPFGDRHKTIRG